MQAECLWNVKTAACVATVQWSTKDFSPGVPYSIRSIPPEFSCMTVVSVRTRGVPGESGDATATCRSVAARDRMATLDGRKVTARGVGSTNTFMIQGAGIEFGYRSTELFCGIRLFFALRYLRCA
jgi:hypothetical protein